MFSDGTQHLLVAIVARAVRDLQNADISVRTEARQWLIENPLCVRIRKKKSLSRPAAPAARPAGDPASPAAMVAVPRISSSLPQRLAARRSAAMRGLDMPRRMGQANVSTVPKGEGLGKTGLGKLGGDYRSIAMSWQTEWGAVSAQIQGLVDAGQIYTATMVAKVACK